jgi:hypothetical protein
LLPDLHVGHQLLYRFTLWNMTTSETTAPA